MNRNAKAPGARPSAAVRIIAGRFRGRRLEAPPQARPTSGRAREALFAILQDRTPGAHVLDLYAGSGALGLEAVSRGAARAVLVERESGPLQRNLATLSADPAELELLAVDAEQAAALLLRRGEQFEIVFADPPYAGGLPEPVARAAARLLADGGVLVWQHDAGTAFLPEEDLVHAGRRAYGRNVFEFLTRRGNRPVL